MDNFKRGICPRKALNLGLTPRRIRYFSIEKLRNMKGFSYKRGETNFVDDSISYKEDWTWYFFFYFLIEKSSCKMVYSKDGSCVILSGRNYQRRIEESDYILAIEQFMKKYG